jgi:RHS repeat-associated protein
MNWSSEPPAPKSHHLARPPLQSGGSTIIRTTYSLAGQAIATRVTGDPVSANNGLFFILSDHLGSTSLLTTSNGSVVPGSATYYLPFGGYRGATPTQTITDRDFTGQRENLEIGLLYYNARYYVPGLGRFASADSIIPNPANPQSYNRYTYVENRPLNLVDPSGHRSCTGEEAATGDETCNQNYTEWSTEDENYAYWEEREKALKYYWTNFRRPFTGSQSLTSRFSLKHPDGVDWRGEITVLAPAAGVVTRSGLDTPAGMWQIENIETGDIMTWGKEQLRQRNRLFNADGTPNEDGLLVPERLLATGQWRDLQPGWSHTRGTVINIDHGHHLQTRYYHLDIDDNSIPVGTVVNQGDVLAVTANNGWSTGIHLHYGLWFEYRGRGEWLNPIHPTVSSGPFQ